MEVQKAPNLVNQVLLSYLYNMGEGPLTTGAEMTQRELYRQ